MKDIFFKREKVKLYLYNVKANSDTKFQVDILKDDREKSGNWSMTDERRVN